MLKHWGDGWHTVVGVNADDMELRSDNGAVAPYAFDLARPYNPHSLYTWEMDPSSIEPHSKCATCEMWFPGTDYLCFRCRA